MTVPTNEEIARAYLKITDDGPESLNGNPLSKAVCLNPIMALVLHEMAKNATEMGLVAGSPMNVRRALAGAIVYGIHLGIHIGEGRK